MKFLPFIIRSQIFVALCGTCLAVFFMLKNHGFEFENTFIIFISLLCGYQYTKFQQSRILKTLSYLHLFLGLFCLWIFIKNKDFLHFSKWLLIICLGLLYNSKFLQKNIRDIPFIKVFYIGFIWALLTAYFPSQRFSISDFMVVFLWVSALVLPFDIRDMDCDNITTFPKIIGVKNTKILAYALIIFTEIIAIFTLPVLYHVALFFSLLYCVILVYFSEKNRRDTYFSFWIELGSAMPLIFLIVKNLSLLQFQPTEFCPF